MWTDSQGFGLRQIWFKVTDGDRDKVAARCRKTCSELVAKDLASSPSSSSGILV